MWIISIALCAVLSAPAAAADCARDAGPGGSYYRKVHSSVPGSGIAAQGKLPTVSVDPDRRIPRGKAAYRAWDGPLDHASVYMGANSNGQEVDAGFKWDDAKGAGSFCPFWRTTSAPKSGFKGEYRSDETKCLPEGAEFTMVIKVEEKDRLCLEIFKDKVDENTNQKAWFEVGFTQAGFGDARQEDKRTFKRVHSIDQFRSWRSPGHGIQRQGNEKRNGIAAHVIPSRSEATGGRWYKVAILRPDADALPLKPPQCIEQRDPDLEENGLYEDVFKGLGIDAQGGEAIDIVPAGSAEALRAAFPPIEESLGVAPAPKSGHAGKPGKCLHSGN